MGGETLRERAVHEAALAVRTLTIPTNAASIIHASVDAVLAMVASAPGLEEALAAHRITSGYDWNEESYSFCSCGLEGAGTDHLADVVRAWLR